MAERAPRPPDELGEPGRGLWQAIIGDVGDGWRLDARDLVLLRRACLIEDQLADLDAAVQRDGVLVAGSRGQLRAHPGVSEGRQLSLAQKGLLGQIELEDPAQKIEQARARTRARTNVWRERRRAHGTPS